MRIYHFLFALCLIPSLVEAQNITSKSNDVELDFSNPKKNYATSIPSIEWEEPSSPVGFAKEGWFQLKAEVKSKHPLKTVTLTVRERGAIEPKSIHPWEIKPGRLVAGMNKRVYLMDGINELEIVAENMDGSVSTSIRTVHVGTTVMADASKLRRTDYALVIATDQYDNWPKLVNPIFDARTIASELQYTYGFNTDILENPTQDQILRKLREYAEKQYEPLDQLFIFFAGHGFYDETFKEGFVVTKESLPADPGRSSYLAHSRIRSAINNNPCEHIFLMMDVCFGGTFDENQEVRGGTYDEDGEPSQSELILRKLKLKTRKYLTSGSNEYVPDGEVGKHSPFARHIIEALKARGGNDGILTLSKLLTYVEKMETNPQFGRFGSDKLGSEFLFVVK